MKDSASCTYDNVIDRFTAWAAASREVKSVFVIGSRARVDHPADEYSDLDLIIVTPDPELFISSDQWLENLGVYSISFVEDTVGGGKERRVLFENALDVDFIILSEQQIMTVLQGSEVQSLFTRGFRILVDKIGLASTLPVINSEQRLYSPMSEGEFINFTNNFWFHSVWSAKKLLRGELWAAKSCVDCYMKRLILGMIEFHVHVFHGWAYDTWHDGRFLDLWADERVKKGLQRSFSGYDRSDIGHALMATMDLFRSLAVETAEEMRYKYPNDADKSAAEWVKQVLEVENEA